jgi:hypothetical protein
MGGNPITGNTEVISTTQPIPMDMLAVEEVMLAVEHHMVMLPWLYLAMLHQLHMPM